jgi:hypothetical protein
MYRSFAQLCEGWTKNLALLFPSPGRLAALRTTEFLLIAGSAVACIFEATQDMEGAAALLFVACSIIYVVFLMRIRKAHFAWDATALAIFGLPFFSYLLLRSKISYNRGAVSWKGRTYGAEAKSLKGTTGRAAA